MSKRYYLFISHGSREDAARLGFESLLETLGKSLLPNPVGGAYLTINKPSIAEAVEAAIQKGIEEFIVVPFFFFEGAHLKNDIPQILADLKLKNPRIDFHVMPAMSSIEGFADWVVSNITQPERKNLQ